MISILSHGRTENLRFGYDKKVRDYLMSAGITQDAFDEAILSPPDGGSRLYTMADPSQASEFLNRVLEDGTNITLRSNNKSGARTRVLVVTARGTTIEIPIERDARVADILEGAGIAVHGKEWYKDGKPVNLLDTIEATGGEVRLSAMERNDNG